MENENIKICFDCDGTIIHKNERGELIPRYTMIALMQAFQNLGVDMYLWSSRGISWATSWKDKLGLEGVKIVSKGSFKPDISVDDEDHTLGKVNLDANGNNSHIKAMFDVNGTLLHSDKDEDNRGNSLEDRPRYAIIILYKTFQNIGIDCGIWTSHGRHFAKKWRKRLGLDGDCYKKDENMRPELCIDNKDKLGIINFKV